MIRIKLLISRFLQIFAS